MGDKSDYLSSVWQISSLFTYLPCEILIRENVLSSVKSCLMPEHIFQENVFFAIASELGPVGGNPLSVIQETSPHQNPNHNARRSLAVAVHCLEF